MAKKFLTASLCLCMLFVPLSVSAQTDECSDSTALTVQSVLNSAVASACSKSGKKQKKDINKQIKQLKNRGVKDVLGKAFVNLAVAELNELKRSSCSDQTAEDACTAETAITPADAQSNIEAASCNEKQKNKRRRELSRSKKGMKKATLDETFKTTITTTLDTLKDSEACGQGGEASASKCQKNRKSSDGILGGWLHKPKADHNPSFVNLLPSSDRASFCVYETKQGKKLWNAQYTGIANGNRQHFRPSGLPSCSKAPSNMVFRCKIGNSNVCYTVANACNRYD